MIADAEKIGEKVQRLRRNLEQMSPDMLRRYAQTIERFRQEILRDCEVYVKRYALTFSALTGDAEGAAGIRSRAAELGASPWWMDRWNRIRDGIFNRYDAGELVSQVARMSVEADFCVYAPYWTSKTRTHPETGEVTNELMDVYHDGRYYWDARHGVWRGKNGTTWVIRERPPTMELYAERYRREVVFLGSDSTVNL